MKYDRLRGSTSNMVRVFIPDNTSSTGKGLTGLTNASTNLAIAYLRELDSVATVYSGANIEQQTTIGTFQAPSSSAKCRFKEVDATNLPGVYELQFHDSATIFGTADTSRNVIINVLELTTTALKIGPNLAEIRLIAWDMQTALSSTTIGTVTTYTGNTPQTGDAYARIGVAGAGLTALGDSRIANLDATVSSRTKPADTQAAVTTVTNLTNAPTSGDFTAAMKSSLNAATPSVTVSDKTGFSLSAAGILSIWNQLTADAGILANTFAALLKNYLNAAVGSIPTTPLLTTDVRLNNLDATVSSRATQTSVNNLPSAATIAAATRDVDNTNPAANSLGAKVNSAASAGDPWATSLPGLYAAGTAGNIIGNIVSGVWNFMTRTLTGLPGQVSYTGPVNQQGTVIVLYRGSDYKAASNNALLWNLTGQPDLTGASVTLFTGGILADAAGSVVQPTGSQQVMVELTVAQTQAAKAVKGEFQLWLTLATHENYAAVTGTISVREKLG